MMAAVLCGVVQAGRGCILLCDAILAGRSGSALMWCGAVQAGRGCGRSLKVKEGQRILAHLPLGSLVYTG